MPWPGAYVFGWCVQRIALCPLGFHDWMFDEDVRVPFYGSGHEQCIVCGLIKVKP